MPLADRNPHDIDQLDQLRDALSRAQRDALRHKRKHADFIATVIQAANDAYLAAGPARQIAAPPRDRRRKGGEEVALWHLTDWQNGKKTATYDMATMDARVRLFVTKSLSITDMMRTVRPVRTAHILFGGDMVENTTTFPGQSWEVEAATFEQIFHAANTMEAVVSTALEHFERVDVTAEPGNHGRIGSKRDGVPKGDNWDRVLYRIVADRFQGEPRLTWTCDDHWHQRFQIGNYRGVLVHGDEFKGFGGQVPMYGIIRKVNAWKSGVLEPFDSCYVGHYHNHNDLALAAGGSVYMTGSTESDNEYAREFVAAASVPSQRLHFVDPDAGRVTAQYRIDLG